MDGPQALTEFSHNPHRALPPPREDLSVICPRRTPSRLFGTLLILVTLLTVSCAKDSLQGRLSLSGSATLAPLVNRLVEAWKAQHPEVEVRVDAIGSDAGLERLIRYSDADLALVSRPLTREDEEAAQKAGKVLVALPLAWDAVCIVVPVSNTWATSLTRDQVTRAFTTAQTWSDLDRTWPSTAIHRFILGPNSGTADVFVASVLGGTSKGLLFSAPRAQASEDDRILARGISQTDGAIGYLGWGTALETSQTVRVVGLDGIQPSAQTIADRSYGLPRQLWLVATRQSLTGLPAARSLIRFLYDRDTTLTSQAGLVPLTDQERQAVQNTLNELRVP